MADPDKPSVVGAPDPPKAIPYKVICISIYNSDLVWLDKLVAEMKRRGRTDMNRSKLLRIAVSQLDLNRVPTRP